MRAFSGDELLGLPVRLRGIELGRTVDLLLDRETMRAAGFDVLCGDEVHRFLPLSTAAVEDDGIALPSPLVMQDELTFYRSRAVALSSLRGRSVERKGRAAGTLRDVVVAPAGELVSVVVEVDGHSQRIPFEASLKIAPASRSAA